MKSDALLERIDDYRWRLPQSYKAGMQVPGIIYASKAMLADVKKENVIEQIANVANLPGIQRASMAMPDVHWGYGFPIGGVAAMDIDEGVISPGGVGFDINCGVRLLRTNLDLPTIEKKLERLVNALYEDIPSGLGIGGTIRLSKPDMKAVLAKGAEWCVEQGYGHEDDLVFCEESGKIRSTNPENVSTQAQERGKNQLGTLGSGNHFVEIGIVDEIYNPETAGVMGITKKGQVLLWIHTGSRGLGHQVADDYIKVMLRAMSQYEIRVPDRQLACTPVKSKEGKEYLGAMGSAANYAWANRQVITHLARGAFARAMGMSESEIGLDLIYDVCHNIAKMEKHVVGNKAKTLCVHRKGATRAFPAGHEDIPAAYKNIGQPVLIPGDMGRYSYIMTGTKNAMDETFGSACHGAGRVKSRKEAKRVVSGKDFVRELARRGIIVRAGSMAGIAEESSAAYKNITDVIEVIEGAGLASPVARTRPVGVIKG